MYIREQISKIARRLSFAPFVGEADLNFSNPDWQSSRLKVCVVILDEFAVKSTSYTLTSLVRLCQDVEGVYVDVTSMPKPKDIEACAEVGVPAVFGWNSFRTLDEYDVLLVSFAVYYESLNVFPILKNAGLKWGCVERASAKQPFIIGGGVCAQHVEFLNGSTEHGPVLDLNYFGEGEERLPQLIADIVATKHLIYSYRLDFIRNLVEKYDNLSYCDGYVHKYDGRKLESIERRYSWVRDEVKFFRVFNMTSNQRHIFQQKVLTVANDRASDCELQISKGCGGYGLCSFCVEGIEAGPWREYPNEMLVKAAKESLIHSAPNNVTFNSFNSNYKTDVFRLYHDIAHIISDFSVLAFRADTMAAVEDYFRLCFIDASRVSIALEGISDRIRNGILNKNVTWEQFRQCFVNILKTRNVNMKVNLMQIGSETDEDRQEFYDELVKLKGLAAEYGRTVRIRFSMTTTLHYGNTPIFYLPRLAVLAEMYKSKLNFPLVEKVYELGFRIKFNSGWQYPYQQMTLDYGRLVTDAILQQMAEQETKGVKVLSQPSYKAMFFHGMASIGLDTTDKIRDEWSKPLSSEALYPFSVYKVMPDKSFAKVCNHVVKQQPIKYCIKTHANPNPKCHGCGQCPSSEWRDKNMINREIEFTKTFDDVLQAKYRNRPTSAIRIVVAHNTDWLSQLRHKIVVDHFIASRLLRVSPTLYDNFYSLSGYLDKGPALHFDDRWGGLSCFEMNLRISAAILPEIINDIDLDEVNSQIKTAKVVAIHPIVCQASASTVYQAVTNVYLFSTGYSLQKMKDYYATYDGKFRMPDAVEDIEVPKGLVSLYHKVIGDKFVGALVLPQRFNPYIVLKNMFGVPYREDHQFEFVRVAAQEPLNTPCRTNKCGNPAYFDLFTKKAAQVCVHCLAKGILDGLK